MKTLGIDYGSKRVGISISDDNGVIAFPYKILENNNINILLQDIITIIKKYNIKRIVFGESLDKNNSPNPIHFETQKIIDSLRLMLINDLQLKSIEIFLQKEWYSSVEARNTPTRLTKSGNKKVICKEDKYIDDKAACIILQNFLDHQQVKLKYNT